MCGDASEEGDGHVEKYAHERDADAEDEQPESPGVVRIGLVAWIVVVHDAEQRRDHCDRAAQDAAADHDGLDGPERIVGLHPGGRESQREAEQQAGGGHHRLAVRLQGILRVHGIIAREWTPVRIS